MRKISWKKQGTLAAYSHELEYSPETRTVYVYQSLSTGERETCVRLPGQPEPLPGNMTVDDTQLLAVVSVTGHTESEVLSCAPELEGKVTVSTTPNATLAELARDRKRAELMAKRDEMIAAGFPFGEHIFPLNSSLQTDMLTQLVGMQMMPPPPAYVYEWKDAEGVYREIGTAEVFQTFCAQALGYGESIFARERMLHGVIEAATTVAEVEAVTWDTTPVL